MGQITSTGAATAFAMQLHQHWFSTDLQPHDLEALTRASPEQELCVVVIQPEPKPKSITTLERALGALTRGASVRIVRCDDGRYGRPCFKVLVN